MFTQSILERPDKPLIIISSHEFIFHKRNVSDGVVSGIGTLFSLDHKLYASDYDSDSDSVVSENQPSSVLVVLVVIYLFIYLFTSFMDTGLLRGNLHERDSVPMQGAIPTQYHNP